MLGIVKRSLTSILVSNIYLAVIDLCEAENNLGNVSTDLDNLDAALSNTVN